MTFLSPLRQASWSQTPAPQPQHALSLWATPAADQVHLTFAGRAKSHHWVYVVEKEPPSDKFKTQLEEITEAAFSTVPGSVMERAKKLGLQVRVAETAEGLFEGLTLEDMFANGVIPPGIQATIDKLATEDLSESVVKKLILERAYINPAKEKGITFTVPGKPWIFIPEHPAAAFYSRDQLTQYLRHELGHIIDSFFEPMYGKPSPFTFRTSAFHNALFDDLDGFVSQGQYPWIQGEGSRTYDVDTKHEAIPQQTTHGMPLKLSYFIPRNEEDRVHFADAQAEIFAACFGGGAWDDPQAILGMYPQASQLTQQLIGS